MLAGTESVLEVRQVSVSLGERARVAGLDVCIGAGELVALRGPSGAGKSSLLRVVAGLDDPRAGELRCRGRSPKETGWPQWRRRVLLCAQRAAALPGSVRDNLAHAFAYACASGAFPEARARELVARLKLASGVWGQTAETLSEGELQRVALLRALLLEPDVFLLDEPTSALDPDATRAVEELLREVAGEGGCALIVTHDPAQAERWCDRSVDVSIGDRS